MDTYRSGTGPFIALVPSAGREASDFNELAHALNEAGYQTHSFDLPTLSSAIEKNALTEHGLLSYSAPLLTLKDEDVVFIGHAYGNRVVRDAASRHPENVKAVILLAAGGLVPIQPKAEQSVMNIFNPLRTYRSRMKDVRYAFFADGNEIPSLEAGVAYEDRYGSSQSYCGKRG